MQRSGTTPRHRWPGTALGAALLVSSLAVAGGGGAPAAAADPVAEKRAEAERLARDLEAQGERVSVLAEELNQARIRAAEVDERVRAAEVELATAERQLAAVRGRLRNRAVASYVRGDALPIEEMLVSGSANDVVVRRTYEATVAGREQAAIVSIDRAQEERRAQRQHLEAARTSAQVVLDQVEGRRRAAQEAASARRATLAEVQGELTALVEAETRRRAEEQARRVQAELASRQAREEAARSAAARQAAARQAEEAARRAATTSVPLARLPLGRAPSSDDDDAAETSTRPPAAGAEAAVEEARRQLGKPYVYGASGPGSFDCSGLTAWAWKAGGRTLPHSSQAQYGATTRVRVDDIEPGDLVFYGSPIHHVGIYAGEGQMVEASETGTPVRMASIFRRDLVGVGRVG